MSSRNRDKRVQNRITRTSAMEQAQRRAQRRRWEIASGGLVLALIVALVLVVRPGGGDKKSTTSTTTTTSDVTTTTHGDAAGKPCVALKDKVPAGSPNVAVKVGPPPTQLVKQDLKIGTGAVVKPGATVKVNYTGVSCSTGKIFETSFGTGQPAEFALDQVIKGWTDGLPGMKVGGERLLGIPSAQAYGPQGSDKVAPDEALWFVVSVISTK